MSWFFGSKKPKPEVYVSNEVVEGDFHVVTTSQSQDPNRNSFSYGGGGGSRINPYHQHTGGGLMYPTSGPRQAMYPPVPSPLQYPTMPEPYLAVCPAAPPGYVPRPAHPLDSIPFKLSSRLDSSTSFQNRKILNELEYIRKLLDRISEKMTSSEYNYNFELERSVLREEGLAN